MKIFFETFKGTRFEIVVEPMDSVAKVKKNVEDVVGATAYPAAQQILIYRGKVLRDETTMEANKVLEKSVIAIMMSKDKAAPPPRNIRVPASIPISATATESPPVLTNLPPTALTSTATSSPVDRSSLEIESSIKQILEVGGGNWSRELVTYILHKAYFNPERAIEYLYSGISVETANPLSMPQYQELATPLPQYQEHADPLPPTQEFADPLPLSPEPTTLAALRLEPLFYHSTEGLRTPDFLRDGEHHQSPRRLVQPSALENDEGGDPYNYPFDRIEQFSDEDLHNVMANPNPNLMDMSFLENLPPSVFPTLPVDVDETKLIHELDLSITNYDTNYEFDTLSFVDDECTISWDMFEPSNDDLNKHNNYVVPGDIDIDNGNNNFVETTRLEVSTRVFGDANGLDFETCGTSSMAVMVPKISNGMNVCTCCKMLRELVHTKEGEMNTMSIYGRNGFFCHAIIQTSDSIDRQAQTLKDLTIEEVKRFIEVYCSERVASGLSLAQDSNVAFYEAMSSNSIFNQSLPIMTIPSRTDVPMSLVSPDEALDVSSAPLHVGLREEPTIAVPKERERRKTPLAAQRERTGKLTVKDLSMCFHLPIKTAAKQMNLCVTVIKKICRDGGLSRWPYRKINSIQKKIESLKSLLNTAKDREEKIRAEADIEQLQRQIDKICSDALNNMK